MWVADSSSINARAIILGNMCGIVGHVSHKDPIDPDGFLRMMRVIAHRGPDGQGTLAFNCQTKQTILNHEPFRAGTKGSSASLVNGSDLMLGQLRLSIIDLSEAGSQPMIYGDRYWLTFNGEIYNYIELKDELVLLGHTFSSHSDSEVLLAAYAQWGKAMLTKLVGMFAFAILDTQELTLFLARDFFGIKPLFYTQANRDFFFASEIKALLEHPEVSRKANDQRLFEYLSLGYTDGTEASFFADIQSLPPAHCMTVDLKQKSVSTPERYWSVDRQSRSNLSFDSAAEELRELFLDSIRLHLRSDVPVGACLSGGIDSSAIVMSMRHIGGKSLDIHTFTYVADDEAVSEEKWADVIAKAANTIHHKTKPDSANVAENIKAFVDIQDEPFTNTNMYVQYLVFQKAKEVGIKVMLDGQGSDEMLGGYLHYLKFRVVSCLAKGDYKQAFQLMTDATKDRPTYRRSVPKESLYLTLPSGIRKSVIEKRTKPKPWISQEWLAKSGVNLTLPAHPTGVDAFRTALHESLEVRGIIALLRYEDRSSMAHSIESRVPFLTPSLANFIAALPDEYLIDRQGNTKCVFRKAMRGIVPDEILDRRDKVGFLTPERQWFMQLKPWLIDTLSSQSSATAPFIKPESAKAALDSLLADSSSYRPVIWRWINTMYWAEIKKVQFK